MADALRFDEVTAIDQQPVEEWSRPPSRGRPRGRQYFVCNIRCDVCDKWFEAAREDAKTCSVRCRKRLSRARRVHVASHP
jgi:hypothetical protein